jgi:hypothetical protein
MRYNGDYGAMLIEGLVGIVSLGDIATKGSKQAAAEALNKIAAR